MNDKSQGDNTIFTFDMSDPKIRLDGLAATAKLLTPELLESQLADFVEREKYEEAAVIKKEIDSRPAKYKYYIVDKEENHIEIFPVGNIGF